MKPMIEEAPNDTRWTNVRRCGPNDRLVVHCLKVGAWPPTQGDYQVYLHDVSAFDLQVEGV